MPEVQSRLPVLALAGLSSLLLFAAEVATSDTLYNGIELPAPWPPRLADFPTSVEKEPVTPPYLLSPPKVIPIDIGRQLFVDDFLIDPHTNLSPAQVPSGQPCPQAGPALGDEEPRLRRRHGVQRRRLV